MNIISGEKVQIFCDIFICNYNKYSSNPYLKQYKNKFVDINNPDFDKIAKSKYIFSYITSSFSLNSLIDVIKNIDHNFILLFHNSDKSFNSEHLILFEKCPCLSKIYTQNMNILNRKVYPLPIGIPNLQWNSNIYITWNTMGALAVR